MQYYLYPEFNANLNEISFEVLESADFHADISWDFNEICDSYSKLYYCYEGTACIVDGRETIIMKPGNVYFLPANRTYGFHCPCSMKKLYHFIQALMPNGTDLFAQIEKVIVIPFSIPKMKEMITLAEDGSIVSLMMYQACLTQTMALIVERAYAEGFQLQIPRYPDHILQLLRFIDFNLSAELRVADCAQYMNITPTTLSKQFKKCLGKTPKAFISEALLRKSKELLLAGFKIKEVSEQLGFCDPYYFSRFFTEAVFFSPKEFQKRNQGNVRYRYWNEDSTRKQSY